MPRKSNHKLRKNPAALLAGIILILSGFLFPLFNSQMFGESLPNKKEVMINFIIDLFTGKISFSLNYEIIISIMIISYLLSLIFYLLNGAGIIYNRYSRYASFLSIIYLFSGLIAMSLINRESSIELLGITISSITIGAGIYIIPITGILYLFFKRGINSIITF